MSMLMNNDDDAGVVVDDGDDSNNGIDYDLAVATSGHRVGGREIDSDSGVMKARRFDEDEELERERDTKEEKTRVANESRSRDDQSLDSSGSTNKSVKRCCPWLEPYSPFPVVIWLIMINEFTERFSFYSLRAILALYLTDQLHIEHNLAISLYNASLFFIYITPLLGAWISDSYLGKFKTIACFSLVYCAGDAIMSLTTNPPSFVGFLFGMTFIALGAGKHKFLTLDGDSMSMKMLMLMLMTNRII